jgi:hypothetical protein
MVDRDTFQRQSFLFQPWQPSPDVWYNYWGGSPAISQLASEGVMSTQSEEPKKRKGVTGLAIVAGLFIGMGVGFLVDQVTAGLFIGLGSGFLGMIVLRLIVGEW